MKDIYRNLVMLIQTSYKTKENSQHRTLLHLSMMAGLPCVNDSHIMALCKCVLYSSLGIKFIFFSQLDILAIRQLVYFFYVVLMLMQSIQKEILHCI
jgi:hypothetical protein